MGGDGAVLSSGIGRRAPKASWVPPGNGKRGRLPSWMTGARFRKSAGTPQGPTVKGGDGSATQNVLGHAPRVSWAPRQRRYPPGRNVPGMKQHRYRDGRQPPPNEARYPAQAGEPNPRKRRMSAPMPPKPWPYNMKPRAVQYRQQSLFGNTAPYQSQPTPGLGDATYAQRHRMRWNPLSGQITTTPRPVGTPAVTRVKGQIRMPEGTAPYQPTLPGLRTGVRPRTTITDAPRPPSSPPPGPPPAAPPVGTSVSSRRSVPYRQGVLFRVPGGLKNARRPGGDQS
jgi:hypothetical protein